MINRATSPDTDPEDRFVQLLRQQDEQLRRGVCSTATSRGQDTPDGSVASLDCLKLLERVWPRNAARLTLQRLGKFEVQRILGQGGFGIVYLARDTQLGRTVALKVPRLHTLTNRSLLERFRREARAAALLDHPHIVPVHEAGEYDGLCYIASAYCPGPNLAQWLNEQTAPLPARQAAHIVAVVTDAVAYSHSRGVLHRDIKPSNVMLVPRVDESLNNELPFVPKLGDFGLAKLVEQGLTEATLHPPALTASEQMLGTPGYMAPEQIGGEHAREIGAACDIYSLGAVLYELLACRPPFQGKHVADVLSQVATADPTSPRKLRRGVPRDLETICLKCLQKEPERRYFSAQQLADDLQNFLHDRPIVARRQGAVATTARWVRRRPAITALIAVVFTALSGFAIQRSLHVATVEGLNTNLQRTNDELKDALATARASEVAARVSEAAAQASAHEARDIAYASDMHNAWRAREEGDFVEFMNCLDRYGDGTELAGYRGVEWHYLAGVDRTIRDELLVTDEPLYAVAFSPQQRLIAVAGQDQRVRLMNTAGDLLREFAVEQGDINSVAFSGNMQILATAAENGAVCWWDFETLQLKERVIAHPQGASEVVGYTGTDASDVRWATSGRDPVIRLWRGSDPAGTLAHHTAAVEELLLHPDGRRLVSLSTGDGTVCFWDLEEERFLREVRPDTGKVRHMSISPDGRFLAICSDVVQIWDCRDGSLSLLATHRPLDTPERVCFAYTQLALCVADKAGQLTYLRLEFDRQNAFVGLNVGHTWEAHAGRIYALARNPHTGKLVSGGKDGRIVTWNKVGDFNPARFTIEHAGLRDIAFDARSGEIVTAGVGGIRFWNPTDAGSASSVPAVAPPFHAYRHVAISPDAGLVAAGTEAPPFIHVWRLSDRTLLTSCQMPGEDVVADLSFSRDGTTLAAVAGNTLFLVAADNGRVLQTIPLGEGNTAAFSPVDSHHVLIQPTAHTVRCLNWKTGQTVFETSPMPERPSKIVFSPDGRQMLTGGDERLIRVWDAQTGTFIRKLQGHRLIVADFSVSPDSRTAVGVDVHGEVKLWHLASGKFLMDLGLPLSTSSRLCRFSADGQWLVVQGTNSTAKLVPLHPNAVPAVPHDLAPNPPGRKLPIAFQAPAPAILDVEEIFDVRDLEFSPDGKLLALSDHWRTDAVVTLIDVDQQSLHRHLQLPEFDGRSILHFSADGRQIFSRVRCDRDGRFLVAHWRLDSGKGEVELGIPDVVDFGVLPQDSDKVAVGHWLEFKKTSQLSVWNCATDQIESVLRSTPGRTRTVAVSRDGRRVFNESDESVPAVIDFESRSIQQVVDAPREILWSAFHPSGDYVAGSIPDEVVLFDIELGRSIDSAARQNVPANVRIEYSADGRFLAFASCNVLHQGTVSVWDSQLQSCLYVLPVEGHQVTAVAWSPDNRTLAAALCREGNGPGPDVAIWKFTDEHLTLP